MGLVVDGVWMRRVRGRELEVVMLGRGLLRFVVRGLGGCPLCERRGAGI